MAVIPLGSGDDFAHALGIPSSPERAAQVALHGRIRSVDVARVNGIRYLVAASVGFDAAVARHASTVSHLRGSSIYLYSVLRVLRHFEPFGATIEEAGRSRQETLMFAVVANAYRYGGGIRIAPTAAIDDGLLDLYTVSVCTRMDLLMTLPLAYLGWHTRRRFVRASRITSLGLYSSVPREVFADGEFVTMTPARFDLAPQRLQVLA
jgi:diacylglycerol kinase (ATP)